MQIQNLVCGITDVLTAKYFCDMMGVSTVETASIKKENSLEGEIEEFGQKNISTLKRNLLNIDEILRIATTKLLVVLRGNKPILLDKMMYKEHPLSKKLKDSPISEYNPNWIKNVPEKRTIDNHNKKIKKENAAKKIIDWNTF